jgi:hypothetical protein
VRQDDDGSAASSSRQATRGRANALWVPTGVIAIELRSGAHGLAEKIAIDGPIRQSVGPKGEVE